MKKARPIAVTALLMSVFLSFGAHAESISYIRLDIKYDILTEDADPDTVYVRSRQKGYTISHVIDNAEDYKLGDSVELSVKLNADDGYDFKDIKLGSCRLSDTAASEMELDEGDRVLFLKFSLTALSSQLSAPQSLTMSRDGLLTWTGSSLADSYKVQMEKINSMGQRISAKTFTADSEQINVHDYIYSRPGDYLYTVSALSDAYYLEESEETQLPISESILITDGDVGYSPDILKEDGTAKIDGETVTNRLLRIGGNQYYFNKEGLRVTGWLRYNASWMYFDKETFAAVTGLRVINDKIYYFDENAHMHVGFAEVGGKQMYFDYNGTPRFGWVRYDGKVYYINPDGTKNTEPLIDRNNRTYLFDSDGVLIK